MRRLLRPLLLWLLALALPVQGLAAPLMLMCAQEHAAHAVHADHDGPTEAHGADRATPVGDHSCSVCASCCATQALPAVAGVPAKPDAGLPAADAVSVPVPPYLTDGPERPPRDRRV